MSDTVSHFIVKGTFGLLLLASVVTWALVLVKGRQRWVTRAQDRRFFRAIPTPVRLPSLRALEGYRGSAWRVARAGLAALAEHERGRGDDGNRDVAGDETAREAVELGLQAQIESERRASEGGLVVLASIGSTAPFVGLFGTVWGIIHALRAIGSSGSASLEVVAGPIGEALIATAIGIAVAVPAVLAYNFFLRRLKVQTSDLTQLGAAVLGAVARHPRAVVVASPAGAPGAAAGESPLRVDRGGFDGRREASL
jgi:biopolymer transport protein ExbB